MSLEEIEECSKKVKEKPEQREAQKRLAWEVTKLVHGERNATMVKKASEVLFGGEISEFTDEILEEIFPDVPRALFSSSELSKGIDIVKALVSCKAVSSKGEARRLILQGGCYINNKKVEELNYKLTSNDLASEHFILIRTGKKKYFLLRFD